MRGLDLSNNNSGVIPWDEADWFMFKGAEGLHFIDNRLHKFIAGAESKDKPWAPYYFAHPDVDSAKDAATYFLLNVPSGNFGPALDFETRDVGGTHYDPLAIMGVTRATQWANEFLDRVQQVRQQVPFFYSFRYYCQRMVPHLEEEWLLWLSVMDGTANTKTFMDRSVAIEQWGIVDGIDRNESYIDLVSEEDMPAPKLTMVIPDDYKDEHGNVVKPHPHKGEVWKCDGIIANHVGSPHLVPVYNYFGIPGPTLVEAELFDDMTLMPNKSIPNIVQ